jgi:hypothetical protein
VQLCQEIGADARATMEVIGVLRDEELQLAELLELNKG